MSASDTTAISRELARNLEPGRHALSNEQLREIYGGGILRSRITASFRKEIAQELRKAGLEILSDPADEPLIVRKTAPAPARVTGRGWWSRPKAIATAAVVLLLVMVGAMGGDEPEAPPTATAAAVPSQEPTPPAEPTPTPAPVETIADANDAVDDRDYESALLIAAALGEDDEARVGRRISRHIARRVRRALRGGHRGRALNILDSSHAYPKTRELRSARASYRAAEVAARRRAELRRIARERRAEERRIARRQAREERRLQAEAERLREEQESAAPAYPAPNGPSTENWCGKRDGDGDGLYCESE